MFLSLDGLCNVFRFECGFFFVSRLVSRVDIFNGVRMIGICDKIVMHASFSLLSEEVVKLVRRGVVRLCASQHRIKILVE